MNTNNVKTLEGDLHNIEMKITEKYSAADVQIKQFIKKHPFVMMGVALAAGFVTHAIVEKILNQTEN